MEFISMEHTPKNILIRAIKAPSKDTAAAKVEYENFKKFWNLSDLFIEKYDGKYAS